MPRIPYPGVEDLYPHIALLDDPTSDANGEMTLSPVALGLLIAPDVAEFCRVWMVWHDKAKADDPEALLMNFPLPDEWQKGARRRSSELRARYNASDMVTILRGLDAEYGVFSADPFADSAGRKES